MDLNKVYEDILISELIVARGCTEPIALALAGAKIFEILQEIPEKIEAFISGNIIKNVQGVIIPKTNNKKGAIPAILAGLIVGSTKNELDILNDFQEDKIDLLNELIKKDIVTINLAKSCKNLYIKLIAKSKENITTIIIEDFHNNFTYVEKK